MVKITANFITKHTSLLHWQDVSYQLANVSRHRHFFFFFWKWAWNKSGDMVKIRETFITKHTSLLHEKNFITTLKCFETEAFFLLVMRKEKGLRYGKDYNKFHHKRN
jgi:hypothetical protein